MEKSEMIFKSVNHRAPYIVDEENKCLRQLHLVRIEYNLETGETDMAWIEAETGKFIYGDLSDKQVYANEEQFKKGELMSANDLYANKNFSEILRYGINVFRWRRENDRYFAWVYLNGAATKYYFDEHITKITTTFGTDGNGNREVKTDAKIPETYYDADEVYEFNDYEVVNNDGTKTFREGLCKRLRLTPEQEKLIDKLQAVINECNEAKINIGYDLFDYRLVAFNIANIDSFGYDPIIDEDTEEVHRLNLREARTINGVGDVNSDDSSIQFVVKKDTIKTSK